jgi:uncharacterized membrane protein YkvA (DUF1232 family)
MSESKTGKQNFFEMLSGWLQSLPTDIKILIEMVGDEALDLKARCVAAGAVAYIISPIDLIPESLPILGHIDDVFILRIAVATVDQIDPQRGKYYREKYLQFKTLYEQIDTLKEALGALYGFLKALVDGLVRWRFRGQPAEEVVNSEKAREDMFDAAMKVAADVNVNPEAIRSALLATPPSRIVKLLSDGLEQEAKRQEKEGSAGATKPTNALPESLRKALGHG